MDVRNLQKGYSHAVHPSRCLALPKGHRMFELMCNMGLQQLAPLNFNFTSGSFFFRGGLDKSDSYLNNPV